MDVGRPSRKPLDPQMGPGQPLHHLEDLDHGMSDATAHVDDLGLTLVGTQRHDGFGDVSDVHEVTYGSSGVEDRDRPVGRSRMEERSDHALTVGGVLPGPVGIGDSENASRDPVSGRICRDRILRHQLGEPVGRDRPAPSLLVHRELVHVAIDRSPGGHEGQADSRAGPQRLEEGIETQDAHGRGVEIVGQRSWWRASHCVHHPVDVLQRPVQHGRVLGGSEHQLHPGRSCGRTQQRAAGHGSDRPAGLAKAERHLRADEPGSAEDEHAAGRGTPSNGDLIVFAFVARHRVCQRVPLQIAMSVA